MPRSSFIWIERKKKTPGNPDAFVIERCAFANCNTPAFHCDAYLIEVQGTSQILIFIYSIVWKLILFDNNSTRKRTVREKFLITLLNNAPVTVHR